jgi:hypothetical protein
LLASVRLVNQSHALLGATFATHQTSQTVSTAPAMLSHADPLHTRTLSRTGAFGKWIGALC